MGKGGTRILSGEAEFAFAHRTPHADFASAPPLSADRRAVRNFAVAAGSTDGQDMADSLQDVTAPPGQKYTWEQLPEAIQALMRETLGDPTLELAFAVPETGAYVDVAGDALELPEPGTARAVTPVLRDGRPVAV